MEEKKEKKKQENIEGPLIFALLAGIASATLIGGTIGFAVGIALLFICWPLWIIAYALGGPRQSEFLFGKSD